MGNDNKPIRFAPLIRVSTEQQERKGESLRTQRKQIDAAVEQLGGVIPDYCRDKYTGQEHATPSSEREMLDLLIEDAKRGLFDAVIVADASRWSRDNRSSKKRLEILKEHDIKFYSGSTHHDLNDPSAKLFLGLAAEIGEYQASIQSKKSIENRIERARDGKPVSGKLPWGRTYDKKEQKWGLVKGAKDDIERAAQRYLAGESLKKIAPSLGMKHWNLTKVLRERSGDTWVQRFRSEKHGIDESVPTEIPRLLDDVVIAKIHERTVANRTYLHGQIKHFYLLRRFVFCAECGYAMTGQTNHNKRQYYRHTSQTRKRECSSRFWVRAEKLDEAVMAHIFFMFREGQIEKALDDAVPNKTEVDKLLGLKERLEERLANAEKGKRELVASVAKGVFSAEDIAEESKELSADIEAIEHELAIIDSKLTTAVVQKDKRAKIVAKAREINKRAISRTYEYFQRMTNEEKRELVESFFGGKDLDGNRYGVYLSKDENGVISYEIRGHLRDNIEGSLPMYEGEMDYLLNNINIQDELGPEDSVTKSVDY